MKLMLLFATLILSHHSWGLPVEMDQLDGLQQVAINKVLKTLPIKMTIAFNKSLYIKVKNLHSSSNTSKRLGQYNDFSKTVTLNPLVFNDSKTLTRILIHELAHAYEFNIEKIYKIPEYQYTAGLHKRGLPLRRLKRRNYLSTASVDPYEFKNLGESFPVNFEFFMTDENFQCRKPLLNEFLVKHFNHNPFPLKNCEMVPYIPVTINNQLNYQQLDFTKLYEIHYLFAAKGEAAMSRWGHSMIRMVFCAPEKTKLDESCLQDVAHHWVISFRANVQDIQINNIKGMLGKYPSEIFIFPMVEIIKEYNKTELRDLMSIPVKTSAVQLARFKNHLLEMSYSYRGKYRFFTVNCATETLNFLQVVLNDESFYQMKIMSPRNLYKKLMKSKFVHAEVLKNLDEAAKNGHFFKSQKEVLIKSFLKVKDLTSENSFEDFLETKARDRRGFFDGQKLKTTHWASVVLLERHLLDKFQKDFTEKIAKEVVDELNRKNVPNAIKHLEGLRLHLVENNTIKYDWKGYGIPFHHEFNIPEEKILDFSEESAKEAQEWIQQKFPKEHEELSLIIENINFYTEYMKESIRR